MNDQLFVGIDSGTQGCKIVVFSRELGRVIAQGSSPHTLMENKRGGREQHPSEWVEAVETAMIQVLKRIDPTQVRAISVSGQQHGFVPLDSAGNVLRPAKLWCDTETTPQCSTLTRALGGEQQTINELGNLIAPGFTVSKLLWLKEQEPEQYQRLATILLPHDYLNHYLSGSYWTEHGDSSGTGFYDIRERTWSRSVLHAIDQDRDLTSHLPPMCHHDNAGGTIRPELAQKWGMSQDVLIGPGGGDNMMAAIGTGNVRPGIVTASLGTSGTIYSYSDTPVIDPQGELAAFCSSSGGWLPLICTMNVTSATELIRELLKLSLDEFNDLAGKAKVGSSGIMLIPFFYGERTPALPQASGTLHGLTSTNLSRESICRATFEGVTLGLRYGLEVLERNGIKPTEIRLTGGGARSTLWRQMVADCFKVEVVSTSDAEAGCLGAALQALHCYCNEREGGSSLEELCAQYVTIDPASRVKPHKERSSLYQGIYDRYLRLESSLRPLYG